MGGDTERAISFEEVLTLVERFVLTATGKHLSHIETLVLKGAWLGQKYSQIAFEHGYTLEYLKNDVGPQLWKRLSQAFGEDISKTNCRVALRRCLSQIKASGERAPEVTPLHEFPSSNDRDLELDSGLAAQPAQIDRSSVPEVRLLHNLPPRDCRWLVGRRSEVALLLNWLSFEHSTPRMAIAGIGGIGKTTLLLELAHLCLQVSQEVESASDSNPSPFFEAIIFTSAKIQNFTNSGIMPRFRRERTLQDIFRTIVRTLCCPKTPSESFEEACELVLACLENRRTLLIVDNLDTVEDRESVLSFLYELPANVKAVITSRELTPFPTLQLTALPQTDSLQLIQHQAQEKALQLSLGEAQNLCQTTGGVPAAIVYAVSQLAVGYGLQDVSPRLQQSTSDFARFYFESAICSLRNQPAYWLLLAMALFPKSPERRAVRAIAGIPESDGVEGMVQLQQLSLIQSQQGKYTMLPLTRSYALAEMSNHPEFERTARDRWVHWYLALARTHGGKDWREWQDYTPLEQEWENINEAMDWCIAQNLYAEACQFWRDVRCYTYSQGYRESRLNCWDTPLDWLNWLIQRAQEREDWATVAEMMSDRAWKLTLMEQPRHLAAASILFTQSWELRHHQPISWQTDLAIQIAVWHIQQRQFELADQWLQRAQELLNQNRFEPFQGTRFQLMIQYYQGEICYKTGEYDRSKALFESIAIEAERIEWQRVQFLAKDFLADVAIKQGNLDEAQLWLTEGLEVAQSHGDRCSEAYTKRSLAQLERQRGHLKAAQHWAMAARDEFERLGMVPEAQETLALLQ